MQSSKSLENVYTRFLGRPEKRSIIRKHRCMQCHKFFVVQSKNQQMCIECKNQMASSMVKTFNSRKL